MQRRKGAALSIAVGAIMLVLFNQNCGRGAQYATQNSADASTQKAFPIQPMALDLDQYPIIANNRQVARGQNVGFAIRLTDGRYGSNPTTVVSSNSCLRPAVHKALLAILEGSVIFPGVQPQGDVVCTLIYTEPYATLLPDLTQTIPELRLGERPSGCSTGPDLDQERAASLRSFMSNLNPSTDVESCP